MKRKINYSLWIILFSFCQLTFAQTMQIKGRIVSEKNIPVEYANIILQTCDSTFVTGGISDMRGRFHLENISKGEYRLQISGIGYATKHVSINNLSKSTDLGSLTIDSATIALSEITVTASTIINRPDRKILFPTSHQLKASTNGLNLLQQMRLSRIEIDPLRNTISTTGQGDVQLRINGVKASIQEIKALHPDEIQRIEYHDDPGLRYEGAAAVINIITLHKEAGGFVSFDTQNSPHIFFGNNQVTAKINYKKSEFKLSYFGGYRSFNHAWRENNEIFNFSDGTSTTRIEEGIPEKGSNRWDYLNLNYSYQQKDKSFFNVALRGSTIGRSIKFSSNLYTADNSEKGTTIMENNASKEQSPSLDLYYQRELPQKQFIILNVVGTYIDSNSERTYRESKDKEVFTDIFSNVNGEKYSFIGEGIYEKEIKSGKLSSGLKHTQSFFNNKYAGNTVDKAKMKQAETYLYTEFQGKTGKFNYAAGVGGKRFRFYQNGDNHQTFTFRPTLSLGYLFSNDASIRYRGSIDNYSPSIGDMNDVTQLIDSLQMRKGNPNLKPYIDFANSLNFDYRKGIFSTNIFVGYYYNRKPTMEETYIENNKFIHTNINQKSWKKLNSEIELKVGPIKDILSLSVRTGVNHIDSHGYTYRHFYTNWYYRAEITAMYKNWICFFQIQNHRNTFYGETINFGENYHILGIMYKYKQLNVGVITLNPFVDNWKIGTENRNQYTPSKNWQYIKESSRVFTITLSWNFSFGHEYKTLTKRLDNQDNDSGLMNSGK